jgi:tetratricopeptide (TPR) repeat protein
MAAMFMLDFTLEKYEELCLALLDSGYTPLTVYSYLMGKQKSNNKLVVLRHDIDRRPGNALRMAELEHELGIQSTYYFRFPYTFKLDIIEKIHDLGHEIGYHYEVLSKANGDYEKAVELFEQELSEFRNIVDVKTVGMHGSPLSKYDNRDLWKRYDFKVFGIVGEAYLSIKNVNYFSDTGRSWNVKNKMRDFMPGNNDNGLIGVNTTDELINLIKSERVERLYILAHPERWASNNIEWSFNYMKDFVFNVGKKLLMVVRG